MNIPTKIAEALNRVHNTLSLKNGTRILHTSEIKRQDRELLIRTSWLEEIMLGWYILSRPEAPTGESTSWYASFWEFLKVYLQHHYGKDYCLSAENSIDLLLGDFTIPKQVIVIAKSAKGSSLSLPHNTSLYVYGDSARLPNEKETVQGIQIMSLPYAMCRINANLFINFPMKAELALRSISDVSGLLEIFQKHHFKAAADRLVGAYRFLGLNKMANELSSGLHTIGVQVKENNPFLLDEPLLFIKGGVRSPYSLRIQTMWANYRSIILANFPSGNLKKIRPEIYLQDIQELYTQDAYNSLSIEGYQVTQELIEKVQNGLWNPELNLKDMDQRNGLAARGYFEAFQEVKKTIAKILEGISPSQVIQEDLSNWFQHLFRPSAQVGLLKATDLFGWRRHQVFIRNSRHTPPAPNHLLDAMDAFFQCLQNEEHPAVRAVLGHFIFVFIHPYMDGNGRIARFLMNAQLASGGYPWIVIPVEKRNSYFAALENAAVEGDILPFTQFIASLLELQKLRRP